MCNNYLKTAIKSLLGDKLYSGINILGLAATILIALYVLDETSYDRQWGNADRIYRVNTDVWSAGGGFRRRAGTAIALCIARVTVGGTAPKAASEAGVGVAL